MTMTFAQYDQLEQKSGEHTAVSEAFARYVTEHAVRKLQRYARREAAKREAQTGRAERWAGEDPDQKAAREEIEVFEMTSTDSD